ncbi:RING zinc finger protein-like protein [Massariosphaeria phaeospora]|uniref:E3 ubiquitin-protein ligase listerin n=1 Tax=Massariosphaeria phaeospora TaxID=100035 RepID=A0A7C8MGY9_9PLEO|nr:RING zinc finger protein-like protein [Massariosphaeria phaeospora]
MSKRQQKSQASSARAASAALGSSFGTASPSAFGASSSQLSYVTEPPDLSSISDPNVVVYFRNLSKRDSTTKAKALEDIQAYITTRQEPVEEGVLEAWIHLYPRTSIDNAKSVRQSAHALQGQLAASTGKRVARYMPRAVGAWLCGLYDSDRSVAEATQHSLRQVFNTPEKIQNIRKAYQQPILEYCRNAIDRETALTLSDERTVSPDDAAAKYSRVISACIALLGSLLANLEAEERAKFQSHYESVFSDDKLWAFASHADPYIRRSLHRFLKTCLSKQPHAIQDSLELISKSYLANALNSEQTGSAYDYIDALTLLTADHPTVWTGHYKSKTSVDRRLRQFLKKGSQFGPRDFWNRLAELFRRLPDTVLPKDGADAAELLNSLNGGIIRKDESRLSLETAFDSYLEIAAIIGGRLSVEDQSKMLSELVLPIVSQYLRPQVELSQWNIPPTAVGLVSKAMQIDGMSSVVEEQWPRYTQQLVNDMKTSAPEQSKDYEKSQNAVIQQVSRLATIQKHTLSREGTATLRAVFSQTCATIIKEALAILRNRNGKPYGAAGAISQFLHHNESLVFDGQDTTQLLERFVQEDLPSLILSRSSTYLVNILYSVSKSPSFALSWSAALKAVLKENSSPAKDTALQTMLTSSSIPESFDLAASDAELQQYVKSSVHEAIIGSLEWDSFIRILQSPSKIISSSTTDYILAEMTSSLSLSEHAPYALQGLRQIVKHNPSMLRTFIATPQGSNLLQGLLLASESPDDQFAQDATAVNASIQTILSASSDTKQSVYDLIQQGLRDASQTSVSVETLVDLAKQLVKSGDSWDEMAGVFPKLDIWHAALAPFLDAAPKPSLAIANPLGGAIYLVDPHDSRSSADAIPRDADGYSSAYRITQYVTRLFKNEDLFSIENFPSEIQDSYLRNISLTVQLADDNIGLAGANGLWAAYNADVEADAISFMSDAQPFITKQLKRLHTTWSVPEVAVSLLDWATEILSRIRSDTTAHAYYTARAYSVLVADAIEISGWRSSYTAQIQEILKKIRQSKELFPLLGFLHAFREPLAASKTCERMCNEIVADLTGLDLESKPDEALRQLVLLNALIYDQEDIGQSIAKTRLIFFVKHIIPWLHSTTAGPPIIAELCRTLNIFLPLVSDLYGDHWGDILNALATSWSAAQELKESNYGIVSPIPVVHASLKLYAQLRTLTQADDPNDDLLEAWEESEQKIADGLVNLLKHSQHFPDEFHQPLKMVNDVLARQIAKVPLKHLESTEDLFPLLYVESQPVQQTAFDILHKQIPAAQEQISIDAALEKTIARLPEELLSLILEAPTVSALADDSFERNIPLQLRGYLLSWLLVFDHLEHASFKVKNDYVDHIKEGDYLPGLLNFTFDFLGHAHNKPVDVSKLDITTYTPDIEAPKRDAQWLLTHLYFLSLKHIQSLAKSWYIACKSRPIAVTLEPWTEKFISPPVISAALQSVTDWSTSQTSSDPDPDPPFAVKVAPRAREITASYTVDEQTMAMRITLPPAFPLANAHIEGINRVAVNEQKWQSWLRTSLGAITIFNGSLIDALNTFKRNVDGAMKGQSECAICYSIVGSDRKLPDKRCQTCKNLFHGACLFKWFKSSGSSSCPLCRNPFNYG